MSTETQKLDVLAVMDRLHQYLLLAANEDAQRRMHPMANSMTARAGNLIEDAKEARDAVADLIRTLDDIGGLSMARRVGGPDPMDLHELDQALGMAIDMAHEALARVGGAACDR